MNLSIVYSDESLNLEDTEMIIDTILKLLSDCNSVCISEAPLFSIYQERLALRDFHSVNFLSKYLQHS
jgi:hypothetical protein